MAAIDPVSGSSGISLVEFSSGADLYGGCRERVSGDCARGFGSSGGGKFSRAVLELDYSLWCVRRRCDMDIGSASCTRRQNI
ncbi:hypothetical protein D3C84_1033160 [compost metagenome]